MKSVIVMGLGAVALTGAVLSAAAEEPMLFNMVHHNPGEERWVTDFTEPHHLKGLGYTGQILAYGAQCGLTFDDFEENVVPRHSAERAWIEHHAFECRKNVLIENCTMSGRSRNLIYLKTNRRRGGFIENVTARNITADAADSVVAIDTDIFYHWAKLPDYDVRRTPISGLHVSNIKVKDANYAVRINGDPDLPVNGVKISGLRVDKVAKESISVKNAHNVSIELE